MQRICPECGEPLGECKCEKPKRWYEYVAVILAVTLLGIAMGFVIWWVGVPLLRPVPTPTATRKPVREPTATVTPVPTLVPTSTPRPTSTPVPTPDKPQRLGPDADSIYTLAALMEAEAGNMGRDGLLLVGCNVAHDLYDVASRWEELTGRWSPLGDILAGNEWVEPGAMTRGLADAVVDSDLCVGYPRCRHLGSLNDLTRWIDAGYVDPGQYLLWSGGRVGDTYPMLVCVPGVPELPIVEVK